MATTYLNNNGYIELPITTTTGTIAGSYENTLIQNALAAIAVNLPGWYPRESNIEVLLLEQMAAMASETAQVAASVPLAIFSYMGNLVGINPNQGSYSTALTTWTAVDYAGYIIPKGTVVGYQVYGNELWQFQTTAAATISPGTNVVSNVLIESLVIGSQYDNLTPTAYPTLTLVTSLTYINKVAPTTVTSGGTDVETDTAYLNRLSNELQLLAPRPILSQDYASLAQSYAGVYRAAAYSGVNPHANILSVVDSTFTTTLGGNIGSWGAYNVNSTLSAETGSYGGNVMRITAVTYGTCGAITGTSYPVTSSQGYVAVVSLDIASTSKPCQIGVNFYDVNLSQIGSSVTSTAVYDATSGSSVNNRETFLSVSFTTPVNAFYVKVFVTTIATGSAEWHRIDSVSLMALSAPVNIVPDSSINHISDAATWAGASNSSPPTGLATVPFITGTNGLQYTGTGANATGYVGTSQRFSLPAGTYVAYGYIDATHVTSTTVLPKIQVTNDAGTVLTSATQGAGVSGLVGGSVRNATFNGTPGAFLSALGTLTLNASYTSLNFPYAGTGTILTSGGPRVFTWTSASGSTLLGCTYTTSTPDADAVTAGAAGITANPAFTLAAPTVVQFTFSLGGCTVQNGQVLTFAEPIIALSSSGISSYQAGVSYSPGNQITNNERMVAVVAVDDEGLALAPAINATVASNLEAMREVNFVVNVVGPSYTPITVVWSGVASPNYSTSDVLTAANAALTTYLSPATWAGSGNASLPSWDSSQTTVRYLTVVSILGETPGLDHLTSVQMGYTGQTTLTSGTDYNLLGAVGVLPLPTINGLVV